MLMLFLEKLKDRHKISYLKGSAFLCNCIIEFQSSVAIANCYTFFANIIIICFL